MTSFRKPTERGLLDTWRSEAFSQGVHYAKCEAARIAYEILRGRPDAWHIEKAIMRIQVPKDEE
jgi:hypothetical protein